MDRSPIGAVDQSQTQQGTSTAHVRIWLCQSNAYSTGMRTILSPRSEPVG